jgi:hypothetical protein
VRRRWRLSLIGAITCSTLLAACSSNAAPSLKVTVHPSDSAEQVGAIIQRAVDRASWSGGRPLIFRYTEAKPSSWTGQTLIGGQSSDVAATRAAQASGALSDALTLYAIGSTNHGEPWGGTTVETVQFSSTGQAARFSRKVQSRVKGVSVPGIVGGQELNASVSNGLQCGNTCYSTEINFPVANRVVTIEMACANTCERLASQLALALRASLD